MAVGAWIWMAAIINACDARKSIVVIFIPQKAMTVLLKYHKAKQKQTFSPAALTSLHLFIHLLEFSLYFFICGAFF